MSRDCWKRTGAESASGKPGRSRGNTNAGLAVRLSPRPALGQEEGWRFRGRAPRAAQAAPGLDANRRSEHPPVCSRRPGAGTCASAFRTAAVKLDCRNPREAVTTVASRSLVSAAGIGHRQPRRGRRRHPRDMNGRASSPGASDVLFATSATDRLRRGRMPTSALLAAHCETGRASLKMRVPPRMQVRASRRRLVPCCCSTP